MLALLDAGIAVVTWASVGGGKGNNGAPDTPSACESTGNKALPADVRDERDEHKLETS